MDVCSRRQKVYNSLEIESGLHPQDARDKERKGRMLEPLGKKNH